MKQTIIIPHNAPPGAQRRISTKKALTQQMQVQQGQLARQSALVTKVGRAYTDHRNDIHKVKGELEAAHGKVANLITQPDAARKETAAHREQHTRVKAALATSKERLQLDSSA